jgi:hypothetical protein
MLAFGSGRFSPGQNQVMYGAHASYLNRKQELRMRLLEVSDLELSLIKEVLMRRSLCRLMRI